MLARELGGRLPCARCAYDLNGLSVRAVCPECGTPVRATLLAVVDPMASELRPIPRPRLVAAGVVAWGTAPLLAAAVVVGLRISEIMPHAEAAPWTVRAAPAVLAMVSAIGAIALVRPHEPGRQAWRSGPALLGLVLYMPLVWALWELHVGFDGLRAPAYGEIAVASPGRLWLRMLAQAAMIGVALCLRPNARILAARSLLMRTGRVDRQTLRALASVLLVSMLGDGLRLAAISASASSGELLNEIGQVLVLAGSSLFVLGLIGVAVDCWRMAGPIVEPPLSLAALLRPEAANDVGAGPTGGPPA